MKILQHDHLKNTKNKTHEKFDRVTILVNAKNGLVFRGGLVPFSSPGPP
jgi:hypothetical protein